MLKDFEIVKNQLLELAEVINKFKSEAVQLRLLELVFTSVAAPTAARNVEAVLPEASDVLAPKKAGRKNSRRARAKPAEATDGAQRKKPATNGSGAIASLSKVYAAGFFKEPRTINDIQAHCETNLARRIKANEISGKLARMVRSGELRRVKNSDNQYEYTNP